MKRKGTITYGLTIFSVILFTYLMINVMGEPEYVIDSYASEFSSNMENSILESIMLGFSALGSKYGLGSLFLISLVWAWLRFRHYAVLLSLVIAVVGGDILNKGLKAYVGRERPLLTGEVVELGYSFPSGHALVGLSFYGLLCYLLILKMKNQTSKLAMVAGTTFVITCIGLSRVYLNVHYLTDVIGGFAIGFVLLFICILMINWLHPSLKR
jgi:undecaprenyl-diphosphatase